MAMNDTPVANRIHISFFGRRNAGKSSLVNAVTGQSLCVVSDTPGTTTDPVYKAMELLPLGPVVIIDTPGMDDEGELGELRVQKARQVLNKTDIAVLVVDVACGMKGADFDLLALFEEKELPYLVVQNKMDLAGGIWDGEAMGVSPEGTKARLAGRESSGKNGSVGLNNRGAEPFQEKLSEHCVAVSAKKGQGIEGLKERIAHLVKTEDTRFQIVGDILQPSDTVVLVVPIDSAAPKGRLILPQQQVIRDILEAGAAAVLVRDTEIAEVFDRLAVMPKLVITDSQAFAKVADAVPDGVWLTSFSILMARWKGFLESAVKGALVLDGIRDGDRILVAEGCTHHRQCGDIGTEKLPAWIRKHTGSSPEFVFCSGTEFPEDLSPFQLIIHCGACMLNEREVRYRMKCAQDQGVPFTNYGTAIAHMHGILARSVEMLPGFGEII